MPLPKSAPEFGWQHITGEPQDRKTAKAVCGRRKLGGVGMPGGSGDGGEGNHARRRWSRKKASYRQRFAFVARRLLGMFAFLP